MFAMSDPTPAPAAAPPSEPALCCAPLLAGALDEAGAEQLAAVLKALADPIRLRLVSAVAASPTGELCACDLPELLGRSQPTMSHHLSILTRAGILERTQRGKWAWFRLDESQLVAVARLLNPAAAT